MLWSQIKLTPHDLSDLQITGEFDNRPGTYRIVPKLNRAPYDVLKIDEFW